MRWEVRWSFAFEVGLGRIRSLDDAHRVCAAVLRFATTGQGRVDRLSTDPATIAYLNVPPYVVKMTMAPEIRTITVWWVYRRGR